MPNHRTQKKGCPTCASGNELTSLPISSSNPAQIPPFTRNEHSNAPYPGRYPSKLLALLSDIGREPNQKRYLILKKGILLVEYC
jgi:hypothetical protein